MNDDYEERMLKSGYRVHAATRLRNPLGVMRFACGRAQQLCSLLVSEDPAKVTCKACLKRMEVQPDGDVHAEIARR